MVKVHLNCSFFEVYAYFITVFIHLLIIRLNDV